MKPESSHRTILHDAVLNETTPLIEFDIEDDSGVGFKPDTLTLTLYDPETNEPINGRTDADVLASCDINGHVAQRLAAADTRARDGGPNEQTRHALFRWTWSSGLSGAHEIVFPILVRPGA